MKMEKKVGIITDCLCDLPREMLRKYDIEIVYFYIKTDRGVFTDTEEITAGNIFQYVKEQEKIPTSHAPAPEVYKEEFKKQLKKYQELIYVAIAENVSKAYEYASQALDEMGDDRKRIHIFDTGHLSTGQGQIAIRAGELATRGADAADILRELEELKTHISTSFIVENADFLYYNGKISKNVKRISDILSVHPVLVMKHGRLVLQTVIFGSYQKACKKYVKKILKHAKQIQNRRIFITHAGCSSKTIQKVREVVENRCDCKEVLITEASATVSSNCGPNTFGILFTTR